MEDYTPDFSVAVQGVKGLCPAGEAYAKRNISERKIPEDRIIHIDALPLYRKYTDIFSMDDVPEGERKAVARQVADRIVATLNEHGERPASMTDSKAAGGA